MAMYNFNISSFVDAERLYNTTKPIRGSKIVPLGDRRRKWERIVKVSPKCYVLLNEHHEEKYSSYHWYKTVEEQIAEAAVTWTLTDNNNSVVEFRNGDGDYAHNSRYSFLERCMPREMSFVVDSGKQYVRYREERHFLPKDNDKTVVFKDAHTPQCAWRLTSKPHPLPVVRKRVNKEEKKPYKEAINTYLEWVWTMAPILTTGEPESRSLGTFGSISRAHGFSYEMMRDIRRECGNKMNSTTAFRDALLNEADEARTPMAMWFMSDLSNLIMREVNWGETPPSLTANPKKFRARFNTWVNDYAGFTETFNEYKG